MNGISEVADRTHSTRGREPARLAYRLDNGSSNEPWNVRILLVAEVNVGLLS
ncbi:hypothetical protein [Mycobacterium asiaticum]|uniref:hypothetical protein n=1 Tax=Mycobacterium asiaticum TaxID=1790 RepID=UPI00155FDC83|nr:hypothetical protein [Mycobacterium asiaticum]